MVDYVAENLRYHLRSTLHHLLQEIEMSVVTGLPTKGGRRHGSPSSSQDKRMARIAPFFPLELGDFFSFSSFFFKKSSGNKNQWKVPPCSTAKKEARLLLAYHRSHLGQCVNAGVWVLGLLELSNSWSPNRSWFYQDRPRVQVEFRGVCKVGELIFFFEDMLYWYWSINVA